MNKRQRKKRLNKFGIHLIETMKQFIPGRLLFGSKLKQIDGGNYKPLTFSKDMTIYDPEAGISYEDYVKSLYKKPVVDSGPNSV